MIAVCIAYPVKRVGRNGTSKGHKFSLIAQNIKIKNMAFKHGVLKNEFAEPGSPFGSVE